jgi:glucose uptake protein
MILPQTYTGVLILAILGLLCLGSWANFYKLAGKWRYEFFYLDFAFGVMGAAVIAAFTLGSLGFDGFSVSDDLINAGKRQWMFAFVAGVVFNLGNMLLMGAVSLAGMAFAFPVAMGLTLVIVMWLGKFSGTGMNAGLLVSGSAAVLLAVMLDALAYGTVMKRRRAEFLAAGKKRSARSATAVKGIILGTLGGIIMAAMYPLLRRATLPEIGVGPFSLTLLFSLGLFVSTLVYSIFLMNLPIEGEPADLSEYVRNRPTVHLYGLFAGAVWCSGMLANWVAVSVPKEIQLDRNLALGLSQGGMVIAAVWGLALWRDYRRASGAGKALAVAMLLLLISGVVLLTLALNPVRA